MPKARKGGATTAIADQGIIDALAEKQLLPAAWKDLSHKNLVLKCGQYQLDPKGKKDTLANRLYSHLNPGAGHTLEPSIENFHPLCTPPGNLLPPTATVNRAPPPDMAVTDASMLCYAIARLQAQQQQ